MKMLEKHKFLSFDSEAPQTKALPSSREVKIQHLYIYVSLLLHVHRLVPFVFSVVFTSNVYEYFLVSSI